MYLDLRYLYWKSRQVLSEIYLFTFLFFLNFCSEFQRRHYENKESLELTHAHFLFINWFTLMKYNVNFTQCKKSRQSEKKLFTVHADIL